MKRKLQKGKVHFSPMRMIAIIFLLIILLGSLLLLLPIASRDGSSVSFGKAVFTATSATCVTGLSLCDTYTQWSLFGQTVILIMIELGGLGFMSAASGVWLLFRKKVSMRQRMLIAQSVGVEQLGGIFRLQKHMLLGSITIQGLGALLLFSRFCLEFGWKRALWMGIFHAVSAFCNAGFDILGCVQPGQSLSFYSVDPVIGFTVMLLIIAGGLGFVVWEEAFQTRSFRKWSLYSKLVIFVSLSLILLGAIGFWLLEWNNPATLGKLNFWQKCMAGLFQSVTLRTAGFSGISQDGLTEAGKAWSIFFMLIGGSSGSTAGGLKTVTFFVILLFLYSYARGRSTTSIFHRTVSNRQIMNALTVCGIMLALSFFGGMFLCATSAVSFTDALYEAVSALATVGLTTGITERLHWASRILIMIYMYFGRVGILTISLGFWTERSAEDRYRYAEAKLLIG